MYINSETQEDMVSSAPHTLVVEREPVTPMKTFEPVDPVDPVQHVDVPRDITVGR
jgi:hypothetical protein